jgi:hypothetical protein
LCALALPSIHHGNVTTVSETIEVDGVDVQISNPDKVFFPTLGLTKMDLVRYHLDVIRGVLAGVPSVDPAELTMLTVPQRFVSERQEREGLGEAPYPPHFPKAEGEPARVQPSKARGPNAGRSKARRSKGSEAKDSQP